MNALKVFGFVAAALGAFCVGFAWRDLKSGELPDSEAVARALGRGEAKAKATPTQLFEENRKRISTRYYRVVDASNLKYSAFEGMMAALGDPHTSFLEPVTARSFSQDTEGNFVGVGARLAPDPLGAKVMTVFESGPADRAGLKGGDIITGVDGIAVGGKATDDIVLKIRGKNDTIVRLQVVRAGASKPITISIRRGVIVPPTAEGRVIEGANVGLVTVSAFAKTTPDQFAASIEALRAKKVEGLVVDLRGNPGGLLESAVEMLSRFGSDKVVVRMRFRNGREEVARTSGGGAKPFGAPIVVLINEESASAAEIFAGVMRDYGYATLVGEHTYGKASVQNVFPLLDGSSAKITIARYYLPSTGDISRKVDEEGMYLQGGLKPDVPVELSLSTGVVIGDVKTDNQLQKAIEVIRGKQGKSGGPVQALGAVFMRDC